MRQWQHLRPIVLQQHSIGPPPVGGCSSPRLKRALQHRRALRLAGGQAPGLLILLLIFRLPLLLISIL